MKLFSTLTIIASLSFANIIAQTGPENLFVTLSGGVMQQRPASINIQFLSTGTDTIDVHDTVTATQATWGMAALPFTISGDSGIIDKADSRPTIDKYMVYKMGIYSNHADTITVGASSFFDSLSANISNNKRISYVYLEDLTTGLFYSILNHDVLLPIPVVDSALVMNYNLHVMVESAISITSGNCITPGGSVFISNSNHAEWNYTLSQNGNVIGSSSVFSDDTTLTNIAPSNYTVTVYAGSLLSDSVEIIVSGPAVLTANFTPGSYAVNVNDTVSFTNLSTGAVSYTWSFGDNTSDSLENPVHAFDSAGTFTVTLTAFNVYGCNTTFTVEITVNASSNIPQAPPFSSSLHLASTGQFEDNSSVLSNTIAPTIYTVESGIAVNQHTEGKQGTVEIRNMNGQLITSAPVIDQVTTLPVNETGIYLVTIIYTNGEVITKKVMIAR
jgi:PKD repeat protein